MIMIMMEFAGATCGMMSKRRMEMGFTQARGRKERKERTNKLVHMRGRQCGI